MNLLLPFIEKIINHALSMDENTAARLQTIKDQMIIVEISDWNIATRILVGDGVLHLYAAKDSDKSSAPEKNSGLKNNSCKEKNNDAEDVDCIITTTLPALLKAMRLKKKKQAGIAPGIHINGKAYVAQGLLSAMTDLDIDWEEKLSHRLGDRTAHHLGKTARAAKSFIKKASSHLQQQLSSYLQDETQILPKKHRAKTQAAEINNLRDDVDRLEARIHHLQARLVK
jgi:ubiquinone biosynthesis protein UbiJ